jgi:hypothetical protein
MNGRVSSDKWLMAHIACVLVLHTRNALVGEESAEHFIVFFQKHVLWAAAGQIGFSRRVVNTEITIFGAAASSDDSIAMLAPRIHVVVRQHQARDAVGQPSALLQQARDLATVHLLYIDYIRERRGYFYQHLGAHFAYSLRLEQFRQRLFFSLALGQLAHHCYVHVGRHQKIRHVSLSALIKILFEICQRITEYVCKILEPKKNFCASCRKKKTLHYR